jgi:hypothetical protein
MLYDVENRKYVNSGGLKFQAQHGGLSRWAAGLIDLNVVFGKKTIQHIGS